MNPHKVFETYLSENDSRYTSQKRAIAEKLFKVKEHVEIDDFIAKINKKDDRFSRATVYRTVKQLLDAGLIQKVSTRDGRVFYEPTTTQTQHAHLICNQCGSIIEIKESQVQRELESYCDGIGFQPEYQSLHIYGVCNTCTNADSAD